MTVTFDYFLDGERGSDTFRIDDPEQAHAKFEELCRRVREQLPLNLKGIELLDEPDFYGFRDKETGNYIRAFII